MAEMVTARSLLFGVRKMDGLSHLLAHLYLLADGLPVAMAYFYLLGWWLIWSEIFPYREGESARYSLRSVLVLVTVGALFLAFLKWQGVFGNN